MTKGAKLLKAARNRPDNLWFDELCQLAEPYALVIWYSEEDEAYLVEVPELPGCMADGETVEEAIQAAQTAMQMWIGAAHKLGRLVPKPARSREAILHLQPATAVS